MKKVLNTEEMIAMTQSKPFGYALCVKEDCPQKGQCLRYQQYQKDNGKSRMINIINPLTIASTPCKMFSDASKPGKYAIGMYRIVLRLNPDQKARFQDRCMRSFCKTVFYEMRGGQRVITPMEMSLIIKAGQAEGITICEEDFDITFEAPAW